MPFVHITTRLGGRKHEDLLFDKDGNSFPYICFMDADGEVVAKQYWPLTVESFKATSSKVRRWREADRKGKAGDRAAKIDAVLLRADLGQTAHEDLEDELDGLGELSAGQKAALERLEHDGQVADLVQVARAARTPDVRKVALEEAVGLYKQGVRPARGDLKFWFWTRLANRATARNVQMLEDAVRELESLPGMERIVERHRKRLAGFQANSK